MGDGRGHSVGDSGVDEPRWSSILFTSFASTGCRSLHNFYSSSSSSVDCRFFLAAALHCETAESLQFQISGSRCQLTVAMFSNRAQGDAV